MYTRVRVRVPMCIMLHAGKNERKETGFEMRSRDWKTYDHKGEAAC